MIKFKMVHACTCAQLLRVPEVLPPAAGGARPVPSFAGVAVLPLKRSLYASTLSQLSALSASFGPASLAQPQVQARARNCPCPHAHACMHACG